MKNVVIICHDFTPLKSVAAHRPDYWMRNLHRYGIHVTLFTINWPENISSLRDKFRYVESEAEHIQGEGWDLYKSPVKRSLRSHLISRYGFEKFGIIRRVLTFFHWIINFFTLSKDEFSPLYNSIDTYLKKNTADVIIVSGSPFHFFKYGWYFSKKYGIPWIADYRDEWWNNHSQIENNNRGLINKIELHFEQKWTSNVAAFTSVSEGLIIRISDLIKQKGVLIRNGFNELNIPTSKPDTGNKFELAFAGTIYDSAYLEILEKGIDRLHTIINGAEDVQFIFIGIDLNKTKGTDRIYELQSKYPNWVAILPPMENKVCMKRLSQANAMLSLIVGNISSGIVQTKIYDYLALDKPIINIESSVSGIKHEFSEYLTECKDKDEFADSLSTLYNKWKNGEILSQSIDKEQLIIYSRDYQTKELADLLKNIIGENDRN